MPFPIEHQPNRKHQKQSHQRKDDFHNPSTVFPFLLKSGIVLFLLQIVLKQACKPPFIRLGAKLGRRVLRHKSGKFASLVRFATGFVNLAQIIGTLGFQEHIGCFLKNLIQINNG